MMICYIWLNSIKLSTFTQALSYTFKVLVFYLSVSQFSFFITNLQEVFRMWHNWLQFKHFHRAFQVIWWKSLYFFMSLYIAGHRNIEFFASAWVFKVFVHLHVQQLPAPTLPVKETSLCYNLLSSKKSTSLP